MIYIICISFLLTGRSHNANYKLFSVNDFATPGVKTFAEKGDSSILDDESQGFRGILDVFAAPPIAHGIGNSGAKFFADPQHSRVSSRTAYIQYRHEISARVDRTSTSAWLYKYPWITCQKISQARQ